MKPRFINWILIAGLLFCFWFWCTIVNAVLDYMIKAGLFNVLQYAGK